MKPTQKQLLAVATLSYNERPERTTHGYLSVNDELEVFYDRQLKKRPLTVRWYFSPETGLIYHGRC